MPPGTLIGGKTVFDFPVPHPPSVNPTPVVARQSPVNVLGRERATILHPARPPVPFRFRQWRMALEQHRPIRGIGLIGADQQAAIG